MTPITFTVPGIPQQVGSKKAFAIKRANGTMGAVITDQNKNARPWMTAVFVAGREAMAGAEPLTCPVEVCVRFSFPRPKGHYGSGKNSGTLKASAPTYYTGKDLDKLCRALGDGLTASVVRDDKLIVEWRAAKVYADGEELGAFVTVRPLDQEPTR